MRHTSSFALIGCALISNLASGFSCSTAMPLPTSAFVRNPQASSTSTPSSECKKSQNRRQQNSLPSNLFSPKNSLQVRGGSGRSCAATSVASEDEGRDLNLTVGKVVTSLWGTLGVAYILIKAIKRVVPIALEPFGKGTDVVPLTQLQLASYIITCLWFAYVEGYKGFQLKFSPLVVARSFTIVPSSSPFHHIILAPLYSMGLFHATKKRMIVSWSVSIGVAAIVAAVKKLPYPWRNIVDAGVVVGLTWGTVSMLGGYIISLVSGIAPIGVDPALPESDSKE